MPEVLVRFRDAVGVGRIGGPALEDGKLLRYWWVASSRADVARTYEVLGPWLAGPKRAEFLRALSRPDDQSHMPNSRLEDRAWAAGPFDGEGSTSLGKHRTHEGYFTIEMAVTQSSDGPVPEVLQRLRSTVDVGRVCGPYRGKAGAKVFRWKACTLREIERAFELIVEWLGLVKRRQALSAMQIVRTQPRLPRGNPAWGSHKTHCVRGHEQASMWVRAYVGRHPTRPPRPARGCLVCQREHARRLRRESP